MAWVSLDAHGLGVRSKAAPHGGRGVLRIQPRSAIVTLGTKPGGLTHFRF